MTRGGPIGGRGNGGRIPGPGTGITGATTRTAARRGTGTVGNGGVMRIRVPDVPVEMRPSDRMLIPGALTITRRS